MPNSTENKRPNIPVLTVVYRDLQACKADKIFKNLPNENSAISAISTYDEMTMLEKLVDTIENANDIYEVREFVNTMWEKN